MKAMNPQFVIECVCSHCGISLDVLASESRERSAVYARSYCAYLLRSLTSITLERVGELLGGRDHTTIMHALTRITERMKDDADLREDIEGLSREILRAWTMQCGEDLPKLDKVLEATGDGLPVVSGDAVLDLMAVLDKHRTLLPAMRAAVRSWRTETGVA
jgi:hypothetical protein